MLKIDSWLPVAEPVVTQARSLSSKHFSPFAHQCCSQVLQQMIRSFALEGSVTLLKSEQRRGQRARLLSGHAPAVFASSPAKPTSVAGQDSVSFECWYRERGLLIEISDADYAEPKLAVIG